MTKPLIVTDCNSFSKEPVPSDNLYFSIMRYLFIITLSMIIILLWVLVFTRLNKIDVGRWYTGRDKKDNKMVQRDHTEKVLELFRVMVEIHLKSVK